MSNNKDFSSEKSSSVKNVLIIGAAGYIGGALCQKFSQTQDFAVLALVRPSSDIEGIRFDYCIIWLASQPYFAPQYINLRRLNHARNS